MFKYLAYTFRNAETLNRSNVNSVKYETEKITSLVAKILKICLRTIKSLHPYQRLNRKLKIGRQTNALADYAKRISSELVLFDWALLRQINAC